MLETKPGPPPVLTKRGADILVRVEKLLDEAGKAAGKTSSNDPKQPQAGHVGRAGVPENISQPPATSLRRAEELKHDRQNVNRFLGQESALNKRSASGSDEAGSTESDAVRFRSTGLCG